MKLPKPRIWTIILVAAFIAEPIVATSAPRSKSNTKKAIDDWSVLNSVVVTKAVREKIARSAPKSSKTRQQRRWHGPRWYGGPAAGGGWHGGGGGWGGSHSGGGGWGWNSDQLGLNVYPRLHLAVQPVPPNDYKLTINGVLERGRSKKDLYVVPVGEATVRVERADRPPCDWFGTLEAGQEQDIFCNF